MNGEEGKNSCRPNINHREYGRHRQLEDGGLGLGLTERSIRLDLPTSMPHLIPRCPSRELGARKAGRFNSTGSGDVRQQKQFYGRHRHLVFTDSPRRWRRRNRGLHAHRG